MGLFSVLLLAGLLGAAVPASGQTFKFGSFAKTTDRAPVAQPVIHNLGVTPAALILWTDGKTNESFAVNYNLAFGMSDGTTSYSASAASLDYANNSNASRRIAAKALTVVRWGESVQAEADLQSWSTTTFTLNWTTNDSTAFVIHYLIIGGDVSAKVRNWQMATATGNQTVAGVGFQPDVVIHAHCGNDYLTVGTSRTAAGLGLGVMDKNGNQWAIQFLSMDAAGTSDTQRVQLTDAALVSLDNSLNITKDASFVSMNADGFTVNYSTANGNAGQVISLALNGVNAAAGNILKSTDTAPASQPVTGVGFTPGAVFLSSFQGITRTTPVTSSRLCLGASDGTTEASSAVSDTDAMGRTSVDAIDKTSKIFMKVNNDTRSITAEADLSSMGSDGFTLNWTTNDAVETQILYLALGSVRSFGYMKSITIDKSNVGIPGTTNTTLSDFPVLINCADPDLRTTDNGGHVTSPNGYDIIFRSRDDAICGGAGTSPCQLDHEIEKYDATTGLLTAWVRIPSLNTNAASSSTMIWVYYGNPDVTTSLENRDGVWDGYYKGVWHLSDNAASTTVVESTSNDNTGTATANTSTKTTTGEIASALTFNGTNDYIYSTDQFTNAASYSFTISAWVKTSSASGHKILGFENQRTGTGSSSYDRMLYMATDGKIYGACYSARTYTAASLSTLTDNNWHHVVATFLETGNILRIYVDGTLNNSTSVGGACENTSGYWRLGSYRLSGWPISSDGYFPGTIDEARVSTTIRDADWIRTEYNNQSSPCTFYSLGTEEISPPTLVTLVSFSATNYSGIVQLKWKTGYEVRNLGFRIYREDRGKLVRVTKSMVAGSALFARRGVALTSGRSYTWNDKLDDPSGAVRYWLEDVDLGGKSTWHGPVTPEPGGPDAPESLRSLLLSELGKGAAGTQKQETVWGTSGQGEAEALPAAELFPRQARLMAQIPVHEAATGSLAVQWDLASKSAVKILVNREGWHRVTQPELLQAGLNPGADTAYLRLYADGVEQPMVVHAGANRRLGAGDWIEFYGTGQDTRWTDARVYWLVADNKAGKRVPVVKSASGRSSVTGFLTTVELKDRTVLFGGLLNGEAENFFGSVVSSEPDVETLTLNHVAATAPGTAQLEIGLQGSSEGGHVVAVQVNGLDIGTITFSNEELGVGSYTLPQSVFHSGDNTVSLVALNGEEDVSLVSYFRVSYWHTLEADGDALQMTWAANQVVTIDGFSSPDIRIVDVTNPLSPQEVTGTIVPKSGGYAVTFGPRGSGARRILLFTNGGMLAAADVKANVPSSWNREAAGADVVMISHRDFIYALQALKAQDQAEGYSVAIVDVEDVYDEFGYGAKTPQALRDFLAKARGDWQKKPRFLQLVGDASVDPRNYLGFGDFDFVPTRLTDTEYLETASDDWFADFDGDGTSDIAVGRLSVRTPAETAAQAGKIIAHKQALRSQSEEWTRRVALVADINDGFDFEAASEALLGQIPGSLSVYEVFRGRMDDATARGMILQNLQSGLLLMNYFGHGSVEVWRGDLLTSADASDLSNGARLPFLVAMTCLNGFYVDVFQESLAESLMKAPDGGTVGVWASSGLSDPESQTAINKEFFLQVFRNKLTVGEAALKAKAATRNMDLRRTWILFGDPTLRLHY